MRCIRQAYYLSVAYIYHRYMNFLFINTHIMFRSILQNIQFNHIICIYIFYISTNILFNVTQLTYFSLLCTINNTKNTSVSTNPLNCYVTILHSAADTHIPRHSFQTLSTAGGASKCCLVVHLMRGPAVGAGVKNGNGYVTCTWQRQHECRKSTAIRLPLTACLPAATTTCNRQPHNCALRLGLAH